MPTRGSRKPTGERKLTASITEMTQEALNIPSTGTETADEDWLAPDKHFASLKDAQLYAKRIDANLKTVYYKRVMGELIETEMVRQAARDVAGNQKDALYSFIDSAAPELAALTDPKQVRAYLREKMPILFDNLEELWFTQATKH